MPPADIAGDLIDGLPSEVVEAQLRSERRRLFDQQRLTGPFGVIVASVAFVTLAADHLPTGTRVAWLVAMAAVTTLMSITFRGPLSRWSAPDGIPVLSHVAHTAAGFGWGLTLWLDLDATRAGEITWIALTMIVAVLAGASSGTSGSSSLGANLVVVAAATAATGLVASGHALIAAAFVVFVGVLVLEIAQSRRTWEELVQHRLAAHLDAERNRTAAMYDSLTSSLNRSGIRTRYEADFTDGPLSALYLDLDGFKAINDERGHRTGDLVLVEVARRLRAAVPEGAHVGRLGGDEFVVLARTADPADLDGLRRRIRRSIERPMAMLDGCAVHVTASIGVSSEHAHDDLDELLDRADRDQYRIKHASRAERPSAIA